MKTKLGKAFGAITIAGAVAAGGSAFTASNTVVESAAGIGTQLVHGAVMTNVHYTLDATSRTAIDLVTFEFQGNTLDEEVSFSLDGTAPQLCSDSATGAYAGVAPADTTTYECVLADFPVADATSLVVVVADENAQTDL